MSATPSPLSPAEIAAADQAAAREREFDRKAQRVAAWFLCTVLAGTGYVLFGIAGDVPLPPWSPISQARTADQAPLDPAPVVIPPGYEPGHDAPAPAPAELSPAPRVSA